MAESAVVQPKIAPKNPNKRLKFILGGVIIVAAVIFLVIQSINSTGAYYMTVDQLNTQAQQLVGEKIRVSGAIVPESEDWDAPNLMLKFKMTDESGHEVLVSFHGSRPSNFSRATEAIVEGELMPDGTFKADNLMLKCPSRYEESPEVTTHEALAD
ncbi:MAG: cytochrome c maturation protein CcmE [Caldilineae bacterium]|nr:MAG: cytochrome c maturation protein CcmE [Caldilineae bacterium]